MLFRSATAEGMSVLAEVMVPLVGSLAELEHQRRIVERVWDEVMAKDQGPDVAVTIGTMIEVPRAALIAGEIAKAADFFSFGTNDLTQMTMGISRDDVAAFFPSYLKQGIFADDPFQSIDVAGVGQLVALASQAGRSVRPGMKLGVCGEHGGDPRSIAFFADVGLDYVSCSPYRVPVARLAAAQAELRRQGGVIAKRGES